MWAVGKTGVQAKWTMLGCPRHALTARTRQRYALRDQFADGEDEDANGEGQEVRCDEVRCDRQPVRLLLRTNTVVLA